MFTLKVHRCLRPPPLPANTSIHQFPANSFQLTAAQNAPDHKQRTLEPPVLSWRTLTAYAPLRAEGSASVPAVVCAFCAASLAEPPPTCRILTAHPLTPQTYHPPPGRHKRRVGKGNSTFAPLDFTFALIYNKRKNLPISRRKRWINSHLENYLQSCASGTI